jgi:CheY-like chemotaxis protein
MSVKEAVAVARQRRSILVVDDDAEMRALLLDVLRNEGYDVVEAKDGTEAVLALRSRPFDLILMDKKGAAEYLFKPFRMEELRAAIAKALRIDVTPQP